MLRCWYGNSNHLSIFPKFSKYVLYFAHETSLIEKNNKVLSDLLRRQSHSTRSDGSIPRSPTSICFVKNIFLTTYPHPLRPPTKSKNSSSQFSGTVLPENTENKLNNNKTLNLDYKWEEEIVGIHCCSVDNKQPWSRVRRSKEGGKEFRERKYTPGCLPPPFPHPTNSRGSTLHHPEARTRNRPPAPPPEGCVQIRRTKKEKPFKLEGKIFSAVNSFLTASTFVKDIRQLIMVSFLRIF